MYGPYSSIGGPLARAEAAAAIDAGPIAGERRILQAKAIRSVFRFDVHDPRAVIGQDLADVRAGSVAAEADDVEAGKRLRNSGHGRALLASRAGSVETGMPLIKRSGGRWPSITAKLPQ